MDGYGLKIILENSRKSRHDGDAVMQCAPRMRVNDAIKTMHARPAKFFFFFYLFIYRLSHRSNRDPNKNINYLFIYPARLLYTGPVYKINSILLYFLCKAQRSLAIS